MVTPTVEQPFRRQGRLTLRFKIVAGIGGLLCLIGACALIAVLLVLNLRNHQETLHDRSIPYANAISLAALHAKGIANDERGYLLTGDPSFTASIDARLETARSAFDTAVRSANGPAQRRAAVDARAGFERWVIALDGHLARFRSGDQAGATASALGPGRATRKHYEATLADAQRLADRAVDSGRASVAQKTSRSVTILIASLVAAIVIGLVLAVWVVSILVRAIYATLRMMDSMRLSASER